MISLYRYRALEALVFTNLFVGMTNGTRGILSWLCAGLVGVSFLVYWGWSWRAADAEKGK